MTSRKERSFLFPPPWSPPSPNHPPTHLHHWEATVCGNTDLIKGLTSALGRKTCSIPTTLCCRCPIQQGYLEMSAEENHPFLFAFRRVLEPVFLFPSLLVQVMFQKCHSHRSLLILPHIKSGGTGEQIAPDTEVLQRHLTAKGSKRPHNAQEKQHWTASGNNLQVIPENPKATLFPLCFKFLCSSKLLCLFLVLPHITWLCTQPTKQYMWWERSSLVGLDLLPLLKQQERLWIRTFFRWTFLQKALRQTAGGPPKSGRSKQSCIGFYL